MTPPFGPVKRKDLVRYLRQSGFEGPFSGGRHQFVVKDDVIPNPHQAEIGRELLAGILKQAGIDKEQWEKH